MALPSCSACSEACRRLPILLPACALCIGEAPVLRLAGEPRRAPQPASALLNGETLTGGLILVNYASKIIGTRWAADEA